MGLTQDLFCKTTGYNFNFILIGDIFDKYKDIKELEVKVDGFYVNKFNGKKDKLENIEITGNNWAKKLSFTFKGSLYCFTWGWSDWGDSVNILPTTPIIPEDVIVILNGEPVEVQHGVDFRMEYP